MPVTLTHHTDEKYLEIHLSGKLARKDYEVFGPQFEQLIREEGPLRLLCVFDDFHGWTAGGLWEDIKFDVKHFRDVERLAMVGEKRWQQSMATFCKPFTTAKIHYFDSAQMAEARAWLEADI